MRSRGLFHTERRSPEGLRLARRYFERAIELDSGFAPAYAGLAEAYGSAAFFGLVRPSEAMPMVRELASSAVALDSTLADAHRTLAAVSLYWDWDWEGAERGFRRALRLAPSDPLAHRLLGEVLAITGRHREALESVLQANEVDRFVPFSAFLPVVMRYYMRDYEAAIDGAREGLAFFTDFWQGYWLLCLSQSGRRRYEAAVPACEEAVGRSRRTPMALGALGYVYARNGQEREARIVLAELEARGRESYVGPASVAIVYGALGEHDEAFAWLERAERERDVALVHLDLQTFFDPLRRDPRFAALRERVGLGDQN